ncbi:MAG: TonB-dependent receptor [Leptospiraceae bacterium]|nr:TonB-dependent receptor [Leptospiraceae bacterium]
MILVFAGGGLRPQNENDADDTNGVDRSGTVVVTGERRETRLEDTTTRTEVITREDIEQQGSRNAAEILETQPGVEIRPAIRGRQIRLQGLDPQYVLILVNGMRVVGRVDNAIDLTRFKSEEIERIEIIKGPSSALYGSDAIAGVINIITRESNKPVVAEADIQYGSGREKHFGSGNEMHANSYLALNGEDASTSFTVGWHRSDGYDLTPITDRDKLAANFGPLLPDFDLDAIIQKQGSTGPEFNDLNVGNRTRINITRDFFLLGNAQYRYLDQERVDVSPPRQVIERSNETHDFMGGLSPVYYLDNDGKLQFSYAHARFFDTLTQDLVGSEEIDQTQTQEDRLHEARLQLDYGLFDDHLVSIGADGIVEEFVSERIDEGYAYRHRVAAFLQDEWAILGDPKLTVTPGVRHEADSQFGERTTPKLAARFDPTRKLRLRASMASGYRAPSFRDLYISFQNPGVGYQVVGNPDLEPETSVGYNLSAEYEPTYWLWISLSGYYNRVSNLIDFALQNERRDDLAVYEPRNIKKAYTAGGELSIEFHPLEGIEFGLGYTYTATRDVNQDIPLEGRAAHRGSYWFNYEYLPWGLGFNIRGSVYSKQAYWYPIESIISLRPDGGVQIDRTVPTRAILNGDDFALLNTDPLSPRQGYRLRNPYHMLGVRVFYRFLDHYEVYAGVDNTLDEYDLQYLPERPRYFYFGVRMRYEAEAGEDPGDDSDAPSANDRLNDTDSDGIPAREPLP